MLRSVRIVRTEKWHTVRKGPFTVRNLHLINGAREGIYGLSIRTDRKDRKLVCLRSVNYISFTLDEKTDLQMLNPVIRSLAIIDALYFLLS